jgi:membrane-associated protein
VFAVLVAAAVLGDAVNYAVGRRIGHRVYDMKDSRVFRREYIDRTHRFFEKYGGKTIVIARFVPIVRTFAPFLAGVGEMSYPRFAMYNVTGAVLWVLVCVLGGYFFGNLPFVRNNFSVVIIAIVVISILPAVFEFLRHRREEGA